MNNPLIFYGLSLLGYLFFQVFLLNYAQLFGFALCYIYVTFLILMPVETPRSTTMLVGFGLGLAVDYFYQTFGIHALACTLVGYVKPAIKNRFEPIKEYQPGNLATIKHCGLGWYLRYYGTLVTLHHLTVFLVETASVKLLPIALLRATASIAFTMSVGIIFQYLFYYPRNR